MNKQRKKELAAKGFAVTNVADFLGLSPHEEQMIELRLKLSKAIRERRRKAKISQVVFAERLKTSQSRVAKMEAGDPSVSIDLLVKNLFKSGLNIKDLSKIVEA